MRRLSILILLAMLASAISACGSSGGGGGSGSGGPPSNALGISIAYSPEKEKWLTERIATFNSQKVKAGDKPIFVTGVNKSSGAARTEIKNGTLKTTVWSPSASTWLEVLRQETGNQGVSVSSEPLVLTPVVIGMWKPMAEALGWPGKPIGWSDMLGLIKDPQGWGKFGHPEWGRFSWGHT
ncbi:MAG: substrate-binding domain-containing protein, partial [Chloroflexales bacterium]